MPMAWYSKSLRSIFWLLFLLILSCSGKGAAEEYGGAQEVTATECMPSSLVNQAVCAMTGEYVISATHLVIPGPEQLVIRHTYTNSSNWELNHRDIILTASREINDKPMKILKVLQPSGSRLDYKCTKKDFSHHERSSFHLIVPKGLTTTASLLSGRKNLKNQKVSYDSKKKEFEIVSPSGDHSLFRKKKDPEGREAYSQESMQRMNGSLYRYQVSNANILALTEVSCQSKKSTVPYSKVNFRSVGLDKNRYRSTVIANDGRTVDYTFDRVTHRSTETVGDINDNSSKTEKLLLAVDGPHVIPETYKYERRSGSKYHQVNRRERPESRFLNIHYYHKGKNHVGGNVGEVTVKDDDDYLPNRVKKLEAPVGTDSTPITINRFDYKIKKQKSKKTGKTKESGGSTDVYDAYNHLKTFHYDKNHHVNAITQFRGINHYSPYREECFVWGDRVGIPKDLLSTTYLVDKRRKKVPYIKCFNYDDKGNMIRSALCGDLTGDFSSDIVVQENGWPAPNTHEVEAKLYAYDRKNLLVSEEDAYGKVAGYLYFKDTDNILRKNTWCRGKLFVREKFDYDDNFSLTRKTSDDGSQRSFKDLTGVTERHITAITPRTSYPVGLPERIVEWVIDDFQTYRAKLLKITDYEYSPHGYLTRQRIRDAEDKHAYDLTWEYDTHGNIISETNPLGHQTIRKYDSNDNLILEIEPSGLRTEYDYDYSNRLICKREHHSDGVMSNSFEYDYLGNCTSMTDSFGNKTLQEFDEFKRVVAVYQPHVLDEHGQLVQPVIRKKYDVMDNVISETDPRGIETRTEYNIRNQPTKINYPDGTYELFRYRLDGELQRKRERNGLTTVYEREELGRVSEEKVYSDDGIHLATTKNEHNSFHLIKTIDPRGLETRYSYDCAGRLEKIETGERVQQHLYDALGRVQEVREFFYADPQAYLSTFKTYDLLNQLTEEILKTADGRILLTSQYAYDIKGNCIRSQKGDQVTTYVYDTHDQLTETRDGLGHVTTISYNRNSINAFGQRVLHKVTTDPLGFQTHEIYDAANRLIELKRQTPAGLFISRQVILYDLSGNKCRIFDTVYQDGIEQRQIETRYTYTIMNEISSLTEAVGTPEEKTTIYHYNHLGQLAIIVKPDGRELHHFYDAFGRLHNITAADGSVNYTLLYNLNHQIEKAIDNLAQQVTERQYDLYGELREEKQGHGLRFTYDYDLLGRLTKIGLQEGTTIEYLYDGNLKEIRRLKNGLCLYTHHNESYNTAQQLLSSQLPGKNGTIAYQYDLLGRCVSLSSQSFSQSIPPTGFDAAGNLRHFIRQDELYEFDYDDYYHLKSESGPINHTYSYDSLQNRLSCDDAKADVNALHQLQKQGNEQFAYDRNGNLVHRTTADSSTQYAYDTLDRLTSITHNGHTTHYTYDPFNRRLLKHHDGQIDLFAYHDQDEIGLWRADHTIQELRIASPTIRPSTIAIELNGIPYIPIHDLTGHIVTLLDLEGNTIESYRYTAFGEREIFEGEDTPRSTSAIGNPWQYSEKRYDEESGLLAFGLRYYDPKIGRWISQDPAEFEDGPNRYAYVHNNPLILFDRYGLFSEFGYNGLDWYSPSPPLDYRTFDILTPMSQAGLSFAWDALNNPYVYGSMQTIGGLTEASVGAGMAMYSGGLAAPLGWPIMAHGVDHYVAGMNTLFSGVPQQTATSHLLQQTGIPPQSSNLIDNGIGIVATMGGAALLRTTTPPVVSYRGIISPPPKPPSGLGNTTAQIATEIDGFFKPFTKQYYRENLARFTGISPSGKSMHAHHVFPQKYVNKFIEKNINIHDPKYLTWWEATSHRANAKQYNLKWGEFFERYSNPTKVEILEHGKKLMNEHGIQINY